jgi:hypothetical protein
MEGNRFEILADMTDDSMTTPRTKRTINDQSPDSNNDDRAPKQKKRIL